MVTLDGGAWDHGMDNSDGGRAVEVAGKADFAMELLKI